MNFLDAVKRAHALGVNKIRHERWSDYIYLDTSRYGESSISVEKRICKGTQILPLHQLIDDDWEIFSADKCDCKKTYLKGDIDIMKALMGNHKIYCDGWMKDDYVQLVHGKIINSYA